jgi:hypothetical protein
VIAAQTHNNSCSTSSIGNNSKAPTPIEASDTVRQWFTTMQNHTNSPTTTTASADNASTSLAMWDDDKYVLSWMAREASQIKDRIAQVGDGNFCRCIHSIYAFNSVLEHSVSIQLLSCVSSTYNSTMCA